MLTAGDLIELAIERPATGGRMIARHEGQIVLVSGGIPGEHVMARVEKVERRVAFAIVVDVIEASPDRRDPIHDPLCGGCLYAHISGARQRAIKGEVIADAFARIGKHTLTVPVDVAASPEHGYRMRARLHVRNGRAGFYREGSHELCDAAGTGQLAAETLSAVARVVESLTRSGAPVSSLEIAENIPATERACHLELEPGTDARPFAALATAAITGLSAHVLDRRAIETLAGVPVISDAIGLLVLKRDVRAFFQGNRFLLEALVRHVRDLAPENTPLVDLYAGVGLFGLSCAAAGREDITLVEGDPVSAQDLEANARPFLERTRVERLSVEAFLRLRKAASAATFIVDPPRTGMSREAVQGILRVKPARLVYVSCDVATLARDVRALVDGGYELEQISAFDLFPNTAHVESVCLLRRAVENG